MGSYDYDLAIIGAGPGGYVAAIRARQLGLKTLVLEKDKPGGVCLNVGCIPSKALIHQAEIFRSAQGLAELGVKIDFSSFDFGKVFKKSRVAADRLSKGVQFLLKKNGVDYLAASAEFKTAHELALSGNKSVSAANVIIATGSRSRIIPGFPFDEKTILSSTGALMLERLPRRLLILGAGAIGMEFAHIMNSFGVEVTVAEMLDRVLPIEDGEAAAVVEKEFTRRGIKLITGTKATGLEKIEGGIAVRLESKNGKVSTLEADQVLVAVGRTPNTEGIGLEKIGVELELGFIKTGDYYETSVKGVYAVGDVAGPPLLAHVASKEGEIAAERIAGKTPGKRLRLDEVPSAVYCEPEIGSFGLNEETAKSRGLNFAKAVFPYRGVGKAVAAESSEGLVKILYDPTTKEILGAHVAGRQATEIIHELLLAKHAELLPGDIAGMIHAHPTLAEGVMEATRAVEGWAIHM